MQDIAPVGAELCRGKHRRNYRPLAAGLAFSVLQTLSGPFGIHRPDLLQQQPIHLNRYIVRVVMGEVGTCHYQRRFAFCAFDYCLSQPAACGNIGISHDEGNELETGHSDLEEREFSLQRMFLHENIRQVLYAWFVLHKSGYQFVVKRNYPERSTESGAIVGSDPWKRHIMARTNYDDRIELLSLDRLEGIGGHLA